MADDVAEVDRSSCSIEALDDSRSPLAASPIGTDYPQLNQHDQTSADGEILDPATWFCHCFVCEFKPPRLTFSWFCLAVESQCCSTQTDDDFSASCSHFAEHLDKFDAEFARDDSITKRTIYDALTKISCAAIQLASRIHQDQR